MRRFKSLAYRNPGEIVFGRCKQPLGYGLGLEVGNGRVIPEIKYWSSREAEASMRLVDEFRNITIDVLERALDLGVGALQLETELSYRATLNPSLAREIVETQKSILERYHNSYGLPLALRVTVADVRGVKSLSRREALNRMLETFEVVAASGADVLSIESIGGKEVFDYSIVRGDIRGVTLALGVLAPRDVERLWSDIVRIAEKHGVVAGGDTACGFANTAMRLAGGLVHRMMPHVLAAVVRAMSVPRSLKPYEVGARGPGKDCAYENVVLKAITGYPMSMEGRASAVAHSSLLGNIAAAACDLWSNEQVENLKLFGGSGPQVFLEILHYDVELMNTSIKLGYDRVLRDLMVASDAYRDPQALVLSPTAAWEIGRAVVSEECDYLKSIKAGLKVIELIEEEEKLVMDARERRYLSKLKSELELLPREKEIFIDEVVGEYESKIRSFRYTYYS